jgi:hypothetical protein
VESFKATGSWDGEFWVVSISNPPNFVTAQAKGHSRTEAQDGATELLSYFLGHRDFVVEVHFKEDSDG